MSKRTGREQRAKAAESGAIWTFCANNGERRLGMILGFQRDVVLVELFMFGHIFLCKMPAAVLGESRCWPVERWRT